MAHPTRLAFRLPPVLALIVEDGRHSPCEHGCVLVVSGGGVTIEGPSRDQVIQQATRFFKVEAKGRFVPHGIPVTISGPGGLEHGSIRPRTWDFVRAVAA